MFPTQGVSILILFLLMAVNQSKFIRTVLVYSYLERARTCHLSRPFGWLPNLFTLMVMLVLMTLENVSAFATTQLQDEARSRAVV